jgi:hypothetical protein
VRDVIFPTSMLPVTNVEIPEVMMVIKTKDFLVESSLRPKLFDEVSVDSICYRVFELPDQCGFDYERLLFTKVSRKHTDQRLKSFCLNVGDSLRFFALASVE